MCGTWAGVLNMPYADVDAIAKQIPSGPGALHITLEDALKLSKQLKGFLRRGSPGAQAHRHRPGHRGMPRTPPPTPLAWSSPTVRWWTMPLATNDGLPVTQYIMTTLEELGLLKMDFPGPAEPDDPGRRGPHGA